MRDSAGLQLVPDVNAHEVPVVDVRPPEESFDISIQPDPPVATAAAETPISAINLDYLNQLLVKIFNESQSVSGVAADRLASIFREILARDAQEQALQELDEVCKLCLEIQCKINGLKQAGEGLKSSIFTHFLTWLNPLKDTRAQRADEAELIIIGEHINQWQNQYGTDGNRLSNVFKNISQH